MLILIKYWKLLVNANPGMPVCRYVDMCVDAYVRVLAFSQSDTLHCFCREKMAFFTTVNINVPVVPRETLEKDDRTAEDFFQDDRIGEEV